MKQTENGHLQPTWRPFDLGEHYHHFQRDMQLCSFGGTTVRLVLILVLLLVLLLLNILVLTPVITLLLLLVLHSHSTQSSTRYMLHLVLIILFQSSTSAIHRSLQGSIRHICGSLNSATKYVQSTLISFASYSKTNTKDMFDILIKTIKLIDILLQTKATIWIVVDNSCN